MKEFIFCIFELYYLFCLAFFGILCGLQYVLDKTKPEFIIVIEDLWIGLYKDKNKKIMYYFPIPCIGFKLKYGDKIE